jgi:hypothetical protein
MVQADVNTEVDSVILRVPPAGIDDLVGIRRGVKGTVGDAIIYAVVAIVINPIAEAVRPVPARARVADAGPGRRRPRRWRRRTVFACHIGCECQHHVIVGIVRRGMIEDRCLRSTAWIGRI